MTYSRDTAAISELIGQSGSTKSEEWRIEAKAKVAKKVR
jgi:hypothetical protein